MTSIAKLKDRARKHEQKEDWKAAIEAYQKVLEAEQGQDELELELGLFNRIGDLYLRIGQTDQAVSYYEQAADKYAEAGFYNNAIALCNKALRHRPERPAIYLKLSRLCAEQGFVTDARRWILDYAEREVKAGRGDAALDGLVNFVDTSNDPDVREFLAAQLATHGRKGEAAEQYAAAHATRMERGETQAAEKAAARARALDPSVDLSAAAASHAPAAGEDLSLDEPEGGAGDEGGGIEGPADALSGLETRPDTPGDVEVSGLEGLESAGGALPDAAPAQEEGLAGLEVSFSERGPEVAPEEVEDTGALGGLETFAELDVGGIGDDLPQLDEEAGVGPGMDDEDIEPLPLMEDEADPLPLLDVDSPPGEEDEEEAEPLPLLDFGSAEEEAGIAGIDEAPPAAAAGDQTAPAGEDGAFDLEDFDLGLGEGEGAPQTAASPPGASPPAEPVPAAARSGEQDEPTVDAEAVLGRAMELVSRGLPGEALRELGILSGADVPEDVARRALGVVTEIIRRDPDDLAGLQRRVEFAARTAENDALVEAYLDLADALNRTGAETKARAMYERVLDLDSANTVAAEALGLGGAEAEEETVDLDAILREMEPEDVAGDVDEEAGDPAFAAMLSQFKARVTEHVDAEDAGDHYDLGLAFREMGLIDEAIAEFQTALTGGEERLKVYEELGRCYILKNQYNVALKIFNRALQVPHQDPRELLGVYYHLGQCHEELGQRDRARDTYRKVLEIDPDFEDVPDRMARL